MQRATYYMVKFSGDDGDPQFNLNFKVMCNFLILMVHSSEINMIGNFQVHVYKELEDGKVSKLFPSYK